MQVFAVWKLSARETAVAGIRLDQLAKRVHRKCLKCAFGAWWSALNSQVKALKQLQQRWRLRLLHNVVTAWRLQTLDMQQAQAWSAHCVHMHGKQRKRRAFAAWLNAIEHSARCQLQADVLLQHRRRGALQSYFNTWTLMTKLGANVRRHGCIILKRRTRSRTVAALKEWKRLTGQARIASSLAQELKKRQREACCTQVLQQWATCAITHRCYTGVIRCARTCQVWLEAKDPCPLPIALATEPMSRLPAKFITLLLCAGYV